MERWEENLTANRKYKQDWIYDQGVCVCVYTQVIVSLNSGTGDFSASLTPNESLCNGHWHMITGM